MSRRFRTTGLLLLVAALATVAWGVLSRRSADAALTTRAIEASVSTVAVASPDPGPPFEEIVLPGEVRGRLETPIYARTSGYLKAWYVDIGAHVKAGDLLATVETPEVDQQLRQSEAELAAAVANASVAKSNAERTSHLVASQFVSLQDNETRQGTASSTAAMVDSNRANVERLRQLQSFQRVTAPYDGIITARTTDVGNLINAGSGTGPELFHIADASKLRTYVDVPQSYAGQIEVGIHADLKFPDRPSEVFGAVVVRTASALDPLARTLRVELEVDNAAGKLFPGAFTEVHFNLPNPGRAVRISGNSLLFRADGLQVATVGSDDRVALHTIAIGRDFGTTVEVVRGLALNDRVILNPVASIAEGERVRVAAKPQAAAKR
jgi:RND family efflux transporter MFP subunit